MRLRETPTPPSLDPNQLYASPRALAADGGLTRAERIELLRRWEYDERSREVATGEGMDAAKGSRLQEIAEALASLGDRADAAPTPAPSRHGTPRTTSTDEPVRAPEAPLAPMPRGRATWLRLLFLAYVGVVVALLALEASVAAVLGATAGMTFAAFLVVLATRGKR